MGPKILKTKKLSTNLVEIGKSDRPLKNAGQLTTRAGVFPENFLRWDEKIPQLDFEKMLIFEKVPQTFEKIPQYDRKGPILLTKCPLF